MPPPEAFIVADDQGNEAEFRSVEEGVAAIRAWFSDVLEASCQGLSEKGIEEMFPGLQTRLREAVDSVPAPERADQVAQYASAVAEKVVGICVSEDEREAVGVPTRFSFR